MEQQTNHGVSGDSEVVSIGQEIANQVITLTLRPESGKGGEYWVGFVPSKDLAMYDSSLISRRCAATVAKRSRQALAQLIDDRTAGLLGVAECALNHFCATDNPAPSQIRAREIQLVKALRAALAKAAGRKPEADPPESHEALELCVNALYRCERLLTAKENAQIGNIGRAIQAAQYAINQANSTLAAIAKATE